MGIQEFIGTWILESFEFRASSGEVSYPLGKDAKGIIMYDAKGNISAQLMQQGRPAFAAGDHLKGTPEEIKPAFEGYTAYFGTYEIDETEGKITHHVTGSLLPNLVGRRQVRFYQFEGDKLTLSTPPIPWGGERATGVLIWRRAD